MMRQDLNQVREYIQAKLDAGDDPSWAIRRYQHLLALIDGLLESETTTFSLDHRCRASRPISVRGDGKVVSIDAVRRERAKTQRHARAG